MSTSSSTSNGLGRRRAGDPPSLVLAAVPVAIGVLLVVLGWAGASDEAAFDDQSTHLNVAIGGALVVFVGCAFYLWVFRLRISRRVKALRVRALSGGEG